ncbi:ABC transporter ATP-binding protein [Bosea sp. (in: a-proteobacteria)]|uniref:ABC transporter ATP-binding protein n=1 Tax=Bosea sp. (in: a-proteobacteria) TaxID=1871050 RepID=UPI002FC9E322
MTAAATAIRSQPSAGEPLVSFSHVQKSYDGQVLVVKDLNLDIARGEFLTLLGPSGSGKTTSLMMLAGFETPTNGRITLQGRDITALPPYKRGIGMVFQNYALFPHMTVADNVAYPLRARKLAEPEIARRVASALDMVKLGPFGTRMPAQLSGGQQQRVALARALVFEPELILLDEPLGALDKQLRERMQYELKQIHERLGVTMVYVTHDQEEALTMSDRIAVFDQGRIQQLASPEELYERPANAFVADFVGENNALEGVVTGRSGETVKVRIADQIEVSAQAVGTLGVGDAAVLSLRPERICIAPKATDNRFTLEIARLVYLGEATRIIFQLGGQELVAKGDPMRLPVALERGTRIEVGWLSGECRAFPKG